MPVIKKANFDADLSPSFYKIIDHYINSTGLNPDNFLQVLVKKVKVLVNREETVNIFLRYIESALSKQTFFNVLEENENVVDLLLIIFENSKFLSEILIREPNLLFWVLDKNVIELKKSSTDFHNELQSSISAFISIDKKIGAIKRYYRHQILRIGIRDMFINAGLENVTSELSGLADSVIKITAELCLNELKLKYGKTPKTDFTVFGLGKLGGEELNYSSDVDLVLAYRDDGEFKSNDKRIISFFDFYQELGRNTIKLLTETTPEGYLYRVDTRLRPEGNSGPLVPSYAYLLSYYESRGEIWERQMLIKARVIYDQNNFGEDILKNIAPFIYPKYPLKNPLEEIAKIKFRIESGNDKSSNIKLCKGGVRDIEFSIQALQLLNGGKMKTVRERNTLKAVENLKKAGLLSINETKILKKAYTFYRNIEHRLQIKQYHQTFTLPQDSGEMLRLSRSLGYKDTAQFKKRLNNYLNEIRKIFNRVFRIDFKETLADIERIISGDEVNISKTLLRYDITDNSILKYIRLIVYGSIDNSEKKYPANVSMMAKETLAIVFSNIQSYPDKLQLLKNLEYIISGRIDIEYFLRLLMNEKYLKIILTICGYSNAYTKILAENERLLELIYNFGPNDLTNEMLNAFEAEEQKNILFIQCIVNNLNGNIKDSKLYYKLSECADLVLQNVINKAQIKKFDQIKYAVFALGKLGSSEMGINSDVDLFFVFDSINEKESKKTIIFFEELAREISLKKDGFFELDLRLRPEGKNAPIAIEIKSFADYLSRRASLWERLALTRIRPVTGDKNLIKAVINVVKTFVYGKLAKDDLAGIMDIRKKIEMKAVKLDNNSIDIKIMEGGLVDIEFISQIIKIIFVPEFKILEKKNTPDTLQYMINKKIFSGANLKYLIDTYYFYRNIEKYIALNNLSERYILRRNDGKMIHEYLDFETKDDLFDELGKRMIKTRKIYNQLIQKLERLI